MEDTLTRYRADLYRWLASTAREAIADEYRNPPIDPVVISRLRRKATEYDDRATAIERAAEPTYPACSGQCNSGRSACKHPSNCVTTAKQSYLQIVIFAAVVLLALLSVHVVAS